MLTRLLFLFLVIGSISYRSHAQVYEPGLLVRSNGDTLRGEIENEFWEEPPVFIRFRPAAGSASELFKPRQLRAVVLTTGRYFRYEALPIDHAATTQLANLQNLNPTDVRVDTLLAEVLLEGPVMLWRVVRPGSTHYLVRRPGQPVLDMAERRFLRENPAGGRALLDGNNYRGQLGVYFGDCPAATAAAEKAPFTAAGVAAVVQSYTQACSPARAPLRSWVAQAAPRRRMAVQGGVVAGLRYNHFKNEFDGLPQTKGCADCRPRPYTGLYADLFLPSRTAALYGELSMSTFSNRNFAYYQVNSSAAYSVVEYRAWLLSARLGLRFFFPLPHERQWLVSASYELNKTLWPSITSAAGSLTGAGTYEAGYGRPSLLPNLGLGWRTRRLTLGLDGQLYISENGGNSFSQLIGTNYAIRVGVAYRLGHHPDAKKPEAAPQ